MKNYILKLFLFSITLFTLFGCSFEQEVPDPIPAPGNANTPIDLEKIGTITGSYITNNMEITGINELYTPYMYGVVSLSPDSETGDIVTKYALEYKGYNNINYGFNLQSELLNIGSKDNMELKKNDNYTLYLKSPITVKNGSQTYTITALRKFSNTMPEIDNNTKEDDFIVQPTLCNPGDGSADKGNCNLPDQALKYIGYYRIEKINCGSKDYTGGKDFAGEMVAYPTLDGQTLIVDLPIDIKIQIKNETLKTCFFGAQVPANNLFLKTTNYKIDTDNIGDGLAGIFSKVGLIGLTSESNPDIKFTQIDYLPKNADFSDMMFGDGKNKVKMRLKIIKQGQLGNPAVKYLDNTPYFKIQ